MNETLQILERELRALRSPNERMGRPDMSVERLDLLLRWFPSASENPDATIGDFLTYARALGCTTTWQFNRTGPAFPLLSNEAVLAASGRADLRARLIELIGTNQQVALAAFANALNEP